jgi:carotenoid cleavage dioxygenase-like enzyme
VAWQKGFTSCTEETAAVLEGGNIPKDLKGTYFRNGHALFEVGKQPIIHPFDADGMVSAINIEDGKATFRNRFVATAGYKAERKANRILYVFCSMFFLLFLFLIVVSFSLLSIYCCLPAFADTNI